MLYKNLERYVKKYGYLEVAALFSYSKTNAVEAWVRRKSIPKYYQDKLDKFLKGEINVKITIE